MKGIINGDIKLRLRRRRTGELSLRKIISKMARGRSEKGQRRRKNKGLVPKP